MMLLDKKYAHPRDKEIVFDEEPHIYYINGDSDNISSTTFIHHFFPKFDPDEIIGKMMRSPKWPNSPYFGKTKEEIKKQWEDNGTKSSEAGTKLHLDIELYYNEEEHHNDSIEYQYFLDYQKKVVEKMNMKPYRTEWCVFDMEYRIAGSIDMTYMLDESKPDELVIYDWKRCKKITDENKFETGLPPIEHLPSSNFWQYSLQLNLYKYILEKNYGKTIKGMFLVCLHPNYPSFKRLEVPIMSNEIQSLLDQRWTITKH